MRKLLVAAAVIAVGSLGMASKASAQAPPAAKVNRVGHQRRFGATYKYGET